MRVERRHYGAARRLTVAWDKAMNVLHCGGVEGAYGAHTQKEEVKSGSDDKADQSVTHLLIHNVCHNRKHATNQPTGKSELIPAQILQARKKSKHTKPNQNGQTVGDSDEHHHSRRGQLSSHFFHARLQHSNFDGQKGGGGCGRHRCSRRREGVRRVGGWQVEFA